VEIHRLPPAEVFTVLHTSAQGLTAEEALRRLQEFGPNAISPPRQAPLARKLLRWTPLDAVSLRRRIATRLGTVGSYPALIA